MLQFYFAEKPPLVRISPHTDPTVTSYASAIVNFSGSEMSGFLSLSLSQLTIKSLSNAIFPDNKIDMTEGFAADIAGEFTNQVAGIVKTNTQKAGLSLSIGFPQIVLGIGHKVIHRTGNSIMRVDLKVKDFDLTIDFGIYPSPRK